jgi:hypothetical protein
VLRRSIGQAIRTSSAAMEIGDSVIYRGKTYVLRGFDPMSLDDRQAQLEDPDTGEVVLVPLDEVQTRDV